MLATITRSDRSKARKAKEVAEKVYAACRGLVQLHEIIVCDPEDVPAGKPLISLNLYRLGCEVHAMFVSTIAADLSRELTKKAKGRRGENRTILLQMAGLIERM